MRIIVGFFLLLLGGLLVGTTVDDAIIMNCILKGFGVLCLIGFSKTIPKNNKLY